MPPCVLYFMYVRRQCQVMSVGRVFETGREEFTHNFRISCFTLNTTCSSGHRARNLVYADPIALKHTRYR